MVEDEKGNRSWDPGHRKAGAGDRGGGGGGGGGARLRLRLGSASGWRRAEAAAKAAAAKNAKATKNATKNATKTAIAIAIATATATATPAAPATITATATPTAPALATSTPLLPLPLNAISSSNPSAPPQLHRFFSLSSAPMKLNKHSSTNIHHSSSSNYHSSSSTGATIPSSPSTCIANRTHSSIDVNNVNSTVNIATTSSGIDCATTATANAPLARFSLNALTFLTSRMSRSSFSTSASTSLSLSNDDSDGFPLDDRASVLDILGNWTLPHKLERLHSSSQAFTQSSRAKLKSTQQLAREKVHGWRKRIPSHSHEDFDKYRTRVRLQVKRLGRKWNDSKTIKIRDKVAFIGGVLNIFISGYLIGAFPHQFHVWFTLQLLYLMPIRFFTYRRKGYHYFLADLCYFVNLLVILFIWFFPNNQPLFISAFCLAFGNNAIAIAMWRNSLVFHSLDKVTSLFIHIMPCATLHCLVHLTSPQIQLSRFPAIYHVLHPSTAFPHAYSLSSMVLLSSGPYFFWQTAYHFLITVRRKDKIAAGRPTSFTWFRRSFANVWFIKLISLVPDSWQQSTFMLFHYAYAILTLLPCPIWLHHRRCSALYLMCMFSWSIVNGATFYIDVFGSRFEKELEALKSKVERSQAASDISTLSLSPSLMPAVARDTNSLSNHENIHPDYLNSPSMNPKDSSIPSLTLLPPPTSISIRKPRTLDPHLDTPNSSDSSIPPYERYSSDFSRAHSFAPSIESEFLTVHSD